MSAAEFRRLIERLGWSQAEAAEALGVRAGRRRVSEWCRGVRTVPPYIEASLRAHAELAECREDL